MALVRSSFDLVVVAMQPGDVVAFGGKGNVSGAIKWATSATVSHLGVIAERLERDHALFEATAESGVARARLSERLAAYEGDVWWLPLAPEARARLDAARLLAFLREHEGKPYDMSQAVTSAFDALDRTAFSAATRNEEDFSAFFCSELVAGALEAAGVTGPLNASELTPIDVCRLRIYAPEYHQLKGARRGIRGHNTRSASKWRET